MWAMELGSGDPPRLRKRWEPCVGGNGESPSARLHRARELRKSLELRHRASKRWCASLKYPLAMLLLLALTGLVGLMVVSNALQLLVGFKRLPSYRQYVEIGNASLSHFGIFGACIEITTTLYMMAASLVGLYTVPVLRRLTPRPSDTSMTKVILNSMAVLVLSSALPVLARTLGMSNFDLLADFGRLDWLGNFYLVWGYNLVFLAATALALINTFTATLRHELWARNVSAPVAKVGQCRLKLLWRRLRGAAGRRRHASSDVSLDSDLSFSPLPSPQPKDKSF